MTRESDPLQNPVDDDRKKIIITDRANIDGDLHGPLLVNAEFKGDVQFGDRYVQAEAKLRETQGLYGVPELPATYLPRPEYLLPIKKVLLSGNTTALGITGRPLRVGLQGMGGVGKSILAAALARDPDVQSVFPHGIFWLSLGQGPIISNLQAGVANSLETNTHTFIDSRDGKNQLERLFRGRTCLLILDDVWQREHAELFNCLDAQARACILITTRNQGVITALGGSLYTLDVLTSAQALVLLAQWVDQPLESLPEEAGLVAEECGNLPLALAMAGAMAAQKSWHHALERLRRADLDRIQSVFPDYPYPNLLRALQASLDDLLAAEDLVKLNAREHYLQLAVFPEDTPVPLRVIKTLWSSGPDALDDLDCDDLLDALVRRSLLQKDAQGLLRLHDLQRDFIMRLAKEKDSMAELQARFLGAYRAKTRDGLWYDLPDDGYIYQYLIWHMTQAGQYADLSRLLLDFHWLQGKLDITDINDLLRDYDLALLNREEFGQEVSSALSMIQEALRRSSRALAQNKSQLAGQLLGRMMDFSEPKIKSLVDQAGLWKGSPWLRPLFASLIPPGDPFLHLLSGHKGTVRSMAITPDGHWAVTAGNSHPDQTVRLWDLFTGFELRTLAGEADPGGYNLLGLTPDGQWALVVHDSEIRVWNVKTGDLTYTLEHKANVTALAVADEGHCAITGTADGSLILWNTHHWTEKADLPSEPEAISAVAITPNGLCAVTQSLSGYQYWDLTKRRKVNSLSWPNLPYQSWYERGSLTISSDGKRVLFYSARLSSPYTEGGYAYSFPPMQSWSVDKLTSEDILPQSGLSRILAIAADANLVMASRSDRTQEIEVWDYQRQGRLTILPNYRRHNESSYISPVITPDGKAALGALYDHELILWNPKVAGASVLEPTADSAVLISPNGKWAVAMKNTNEIDRVWDLTSGQVVRPPLPEEVAKLVADEQARIESLRISNQEPGENRLAGRKTAQSREAREKRAETAQAQKPLELHVSSNGRYAASAATDRTVRLWDQLTGACVAVYTNDIPMMSQCVVSEDGRHIAAMDVLGRVHLLKLAGLDDVTEK